ncbi:TetR/AcrR family transcriptional regulator [Novosphingobium sp. AAP83]|uniref:TetR/AcrR family transcriptional regulator n=1 Tax=Novosphingobium sp. AAP83 TaxID=1523425 RepID=UPI000A733CB6|nr:TetR/AcrR family transcriptional regulator [Novosphingobium sp. AAP83]
MRKRHDPRREATSDALVEAAERLFAAHGVDGVSTRQLAMAIGSANNNVVTYYFGSKEALVEAVYRHRLPAIDQRRGELLCAAEVAETDDNLLVLMRAFALPLFEQTDLDGQHSYARFVAAIERSGMIETRGGMDADFPETATLVRRIATLMPRKSTFEIDAHTRIRLAVALIVAALQIADQSEQRSVAQTQNLFETALVMATAGLAASVPSNEVAEGSSL